ncbi:hypothetical protein [Candidatus Borrarchaeum sp.]|uniref:hypothetical protein n=1 Tax=Candidatus Borrarchaeum sp. TaxID=2846742 RepID=UPI00257A6A4B|nr:hypothetical protein [Candidatus Borrarchaeum sp.]
MFREDIRKRSEYGDEFVRLFIKDGLQDRLLPFSKSALELFTKYCFEECNDSDRLKCILRPCTEIIDGNNRRLLDLYIDSGIKKNELPLFCYSQRQQMITNILTGKERRRGKNIDKKIFLEDFLDILFPKAAKPLKRALQRKQTFIKTFLGRLDEMDEFTLYSSQDDYLLFSNNHDIFFMDLNRGIVTLNPGEHKINEMPELTGFTKFFSHKYDQQAELIENGFGWNHIQFQVYESKEDFTNEEKSRLQKFLIELRKDDTGLFSAFYVADKTIQINTDVYYHNYDPEVYLTYNDKKLLVRSLEEIFSSMKRLQDDIAQKLIEKSEDVTKETSSE